MKTILQPIITLLFSITILSCSSAQKITETKAPFDIKKATFYKWYGGQPGAKGYVVTIVKNKPSIQLDSIYFKNMKTSFKSSKEKNNETFIANFVIRNTVDGVRMMGNTEEEYGNQVPDISLKIPFNLAPNEAMISYIFKGKKHYLKVSNLIETKKLMYQ